jgi:DNA-binding transcriptional LysR family regulator
MPNSKKNAQSGATPAQERAWYLDWGHLPFFLELVRTGSLSRAAKALAVDRNTVARRVAALEKELGIGLFERGPLGWNCTAAGQDLAALASRVEEDVLALTRHVDARDPGLSGTVRLTTTPHLAAALLVPGLPVLRERHPGLVLEIAAYQRAFDLTRREADLALRLWRPRDPGLVMRKLCDVGHRLYASRAYLAGRRPQVNLATDAFIGFEDSMANAPHERWFGRIAPHRRVVFRCNNIPTLQAAARQGLGVAVLPCFLADAEPELVRLEGPEPTSLELWLLVHGDLRHTPRVRAVMDWVDELVAKAKPMLAG